MLTFPCLTDRLGATLIWDLFQTLIFTSLFCTPLVKTMLMSAALRDVAKKTFMCVVQFANSILYLMCEGKTTNSGSILSLMLLLVRI